MTIGLYLIVKNEYKSAKRIAEEASPYFHGIYLTVSDKKTAKHLQKDFKDADNVKIDYREWTDRFDEARNHNFAQGNEDYKMWLDADDEFSFPSINFIKEEIQLQDLDAVWLPYEYAYDEQGNCIALHWRERIVKASKGWEWRGWVHENLLTEQQLQSARINVPVRHTSARPEKSTERNLEILKKAYKETNDPRYIHYLGITYFSVGEYQKCIDILKEYVAVGGWDEEIYRSLLRMADASNLLDNKESAIQYALRAAALLPEFPDAYFSLAQFEFDDENFKATVEWLKVAFTKQRPESAGIYDPTAEDKARLIGAISEFQLRNFRDAEKMLDMVKTMDVSDVKPEFQKQASIDRMAAVLPAFIKHYEEPKVLWESLSEELKYDNRFRKVREQVTEPKTWPKGSVVFFCGKGYEEWGPHTLDKGMGGSEEAIVYLSRELAKLGYRVTVYGELKGPRAEDTENPIQWLPWTHIDKRDHFDTLVVWRYPQLATQFKANKVLVDMHDLIPEKMVKPYEGVTYLFKTQFHADKYPQITNYKVIGNGIAKEQFNGNEA